MIVRTACRHLYGLWFASSVAALSACGQVDETRTGVPQSEADARAPEATVDATTVDIASDATDGVRDECRCGALGCRATTLQAFCAQDTMGCPETLDVWLRCSRAGQLSSPGRDGYRLVNCGPVRVVEYVFGIGADTLGWAYDERGKLIAKVWGSDSGSGLACGEFGGVCTSAFADPGTYELLSRVPALQDAGVDGGSERRADASLALLAECANL